VAVIEGMIATMCALAPTGGGDACHKAMDATTRQVTIEENANTVPDVYYCQKVMAQEHPNKYDLEECMKGMGSGSSKVNVEQEMNGTENKVQNMMLHESYDLLGQKTVYGVGGAAFLYKSYTDKKFTVDVPCVYGICDKVHLDSDFNQNTYGLRLQWNFK
jgi:hypothetical protein